MYDAAAAATVSEFHLALVQINWTCAHGVTIVDMVITMHRGGNKVVILVRSHVHLK